MKIYSNRVGHQNAAISILGYRQNLQWIPPGKFLMGSPNYEAGHCYDDETQHQVILTRGFWMFDTPVTQELWQAVIGENPSRFKGSKYPVENVNWFFCKDFIRRVNEETGFELHLPTEAQWEYACRAGTTTATYAGDLEGDLEIDKSKYNTSVLDKIAWYPGNSDSKIHPVGQKQPNPWGLYDMLGNVGEWCEDYYGEYSGEVVIDPKGPEEGTDRVFRGGGWFYYARDIRAAYRDLSDPGDCYDKLGFRCIVSHKVYLESLI